MNLKVPQEQYEAIAAEIHSDNSPVGIDAKKTHILILQKLLAMESQLVQLQKDIDELKQIKP